LKAEYATRKRRFVRYFSQWFVTTEKRKELKERVDRANKVLEEDKSEMLAGENSE